MLPIFFFVHFIGTFSASEIETEIASNHPRAPGVKTGQTRKTSFLIPHHTCYPVTEVLCAQIKEVGFTLRKREDLNSYRRDSVQVIYQYLDENKSLILKIVQSQNTGKLSECAECCFARAPMKKAFRFDVFDVNGMNLSLSLSLSLSLFWFGIFEIFFCELILLGLMILSASSI
ncbi:hypothetical protein PRUPE_1G184900 [Prunus persica]|uniref:Uncharacterized protein n=1 Tax=Prunus persica TaxID=3760 RepID=A0A251QZG1_PRUPE|nr:hypothetical protein PRUPE_1G184900 [Prunus persica]ONI29169.1 hypothetical protein PRUPE_1G184900 [Prunus persica]